MLKRDAIFDRYCDCLAEETPIRPSDHATCLAATAKTFGVTEKYIKAVIRKEIARETAFPARTQG